MHPVVPPLLAFLAFVLSLLQPPPRDSTAFKRDRTLNGECLDPTDTLLQYVSAWERGTLTLRASTQDLGAGVREATSSGSTAFPARTGLESSTRPGRLAASAATPPPQTGGAGWSGNDFASPSSAPLPREILGPRPLEEMTDEDRAPVSYTVRVSPGKRGRRVSKSAIAVLARAYCLSGGIVKLDRSTCQILVQGPLWDVGRFLWLLEAGDYCRRESIRETQYSEECASSLFRVEAARSGHRRSSGSGSSGTRADRSGSDSEVYVRSSAPSRRRR